MKASTYPRYSMSATPSALCLWSLSRVRVWLKSSRTTPPSTDESVDADVLGTVGRVGETLAKAHGHNVVLGDTKPDNVLIKADGTIFLIDFEQAQRGGDKAWDIAVFLYYCGHYLQPFDSNTKAESIANAFIEGYLRGGGNVDDVHKAGLPKYTRVFSIFTMPAFVTAISNVCKKAEATRLAVE